LKIVRRNISQLNADEKNHIDKFIEDNNGLIFHETKFNEIVSQTFNSKFSYFLAFEDKSLIGICPIHSIKSGLVTNTFSNNGSFEIPYGGWVFDDNSTSFPRLWNRTAINPLESIIYYSSFFYDIPEKLKKSNKKLQTGLIDLNASEDDLFNNVINSKRRNMIRKAEKSGVLIKNHRKEGLTIYYNLMQDMKKKAGLKEKPFAYYEEILKAYMLEKAMVFIAYLEDKPLAGVVILGNKNVMHYWQGASANDIPNLGQGEMLQWDAIKWAKNFGAKYYDLCVIEPERLPNIAQFKMGFSKELVPFYCISKKTLPFRVINRIQNVFIN
jgi:hypothetical protein